jgi:MFS transporter, BCD family, chlorophyll transporter
MSQAVKLAKGIDPMRLAAYGAVAGLPAFSAVIFSAPLGCRLAISDWVPSASDYGGGLFAVGTLFTAMRLEAAFIGLGPRCLGCCASRCCGRGDVHWAALCVTASTRSPAQGALGIGFNRPFGGLQHGLSRRNALLLFFTLIAVGPIGQTPQQFFTRCSLKPSA